MDLELSAFANQILWGVMVGVGYALMAMSFSLIFATSGMINFAVGEFAMLAAYVCFTALSKMSGNFVGAALFALVFTAAFAMLVERIAFRRLYTLDPILVLIGTIGLSSILKNLVLVLWGPYSLSVPQYFDVQPTFLGPLMIIPQNAIVAVIGVAVMVVFHLFMRRTKTGTAMRAAAQNVRGSMLVGINTQRCVSLSWGLGALLAGISGTMMAFAYNISIEMGGALSLKGFTSAVFGGLGSLTSATAGGVLLGVVENVAAMVFDHTYKDVIAFLVIVLIMLFKPEGLFSGTAGLRRV
jgi:branched-chain amino acid transport system permease protein